MIISFFNSDSTDRKVAIAKRIYGTTNFNKLGSATQMIDSVYFYSKVSGAYTGTLSLSAAKAQIDKSGPVAMLVYQSSGNGHAMCLKGYSDTNTSLYVIDPWDGNQKIYTYASAVSNSLFKWQSSITFK